MLRDSVATIFGKEQKVTRVDGRCVPVFLATKVQVRVTDFSYP
jgi:hypothetical protein